MTKVEVFQSLLGLLVEDKTCVVGWEQLQYWPKGTVEAFVQAGLLKSAPAANQIECNACPERCLMPVHVLPAQNRQAGRAFVVCDQRDDMGRIKVDFARLQQWHTSQSQLALWLAQELEIKSKPILDKTSGVYQLGSVQWKKRLSSLELVFAGDMFLRSAGHDLPLLEAVDFVGDIPKVDRTVVLNFVDLPPVTAKVERYNLSIARREAGKLDTQAMRQDWQKEYKKLKKEHPDKPNTWIALKIAKMDIAQGRDAETIRKRMVSNPT